MGTVLKHKTLRTHAVVSSTLRSVITHRKKKQEAEVGAAPAAMS